MQYEKQSVGVKRFYQNIAVVNPKRDSLRPLGRDSWYPYYAGFSHTFARSLLVALKLTPHSRILDPWNGSGTTSASAVEEGHHAQGFDINPVMVIAAKARILSILSRESLHPLASDISKKASGAAEILLPRTDPLEIWMIPESAKAVRRIDAAIRSLLVNPEEYSFLGVGAAVNQISDLASFYYVALFRSLRRMLKNFFASNPTWVKKPKSLHARLRPSASTVLDVFNAEVHSMTRVLENETIPIAGGGSCHLAIASSDRLPLETGQTDAVVTSPPYCTRIDYAVATSIELALLGCDAANGLDELRQTMIGSSVIHKTAPILSRAWGPTCLTLLDQIAQHPSKASGGYYLKNHLQYFQSVFASLSEISRSLVPGGSCALVVQDSHYKNVHNDLPQIFIEMGKEVGLSFGHRADFESSKTMALINRHTRTYRFQARAKESVLLLYRQ